MTLVSLEVGSADHRGMSGAYETSLMRRLFNYDHLLGRRPTSSKTGASGSLSTPSRQRARPLVPGNDK